MKTSVFVRQHDVTTLSFIHFSLWHYLQVAQWLITCTSDLQVAGAGELCADLHSMV